MESQNKDNSGKWTVVVNKKHNQKTRHTETTNKSQMDKDKDKITIKMNGRIQQF
jgi:hypothetical protein